MTGDVHDSDDDIDGTVTMLYKNGELAIEVPPGFSATAIEYDPTVTAAVKVKVEVDTELAVGEVRVAVDVTAKSEKREIVVPAIETVQTILPGWITGVEQARVEVLEGVESMVYTCPDPDIGFPPIVRIVASVYTPVPDTAAVKVKLTVLEEAIAGEVSVAVVLTVKSEYNVFTPVG